MNDPIRNILVGVLISGLVATLGALVTFGTVTEALESATDDISMLKGVRTRHIEEINDLEKEVDRLRSDFRELDEEYEKMRRAVICILAVDPKEIGAQAERMKCIGRDGQRAMEIPRVYRSNYDDTK